MKKGLILAFVTIMGLCVWYSGIVDAMVYNLSIRPSQEKFSPNKKVGDSRSHTVVMPATSRPNVTLGLDLQKTVFLGLSWSTQKTESKIGSGNDIIHFGTDKFSSGTYRIRYFTNVSATIRGDYDGQTEHLAW